MMTRTKSTARLAQFIFSVPLIGLVNLLADMSLWQWIAAVVTFRAIEVFGVIFAANNKATA